MAPSIALFALALLFGGMVFFAAVMAPLVFSRLPGPVAGPFIRAVFPVYYLYVFGTAAVAALALIPGPGGWVMGGVAALTLWLRQWLMPRLNAWSDRAQAGDDGARRRFALGHRMSVVLNLVQLALAAAVLGRWTG